MSNNGTDSLFPGWLSVRVFICLASRAIVCILFFSDIVRDGIWTASLLFFGPFESSFLVLILNVCVAASLCVLFGLFFGGRWKYPITLVWFSFLLYLFSLICFLQYECCDAPYLSSLTLSRRGFVSVIIYWICICHLSMLSLRYYSAWCQFSEHWLLIHKTCNFVAVACLFSHNFLTS